MVHKRLSQSLSTGLDGVLAHDKERGVRVRALTESEARVLSLLLADTATDERSRLRQSGLPRSTYHAARRRAYAEGWLRDRYVPAPTLFGFPEVTLALARPFADQVPQLAERWSSEPGNVLLWVSPVVSLGVFFHRSAREASASGGRIAAAELASSVLLLRPKVEERGLPVYFDFEGVWAHLASSPGPQAYPKGLPPTPAGVDPQAPGTWTPRRRWAARELLERPFVAERQGRAGHLIGTFGLPLAEKGLLAQGWILHRVLAEPAHVPPFRGRQMDRIVLISGTLQTGVPPEVVFATLSHECRVFPFLYVVDGDRVLLGALGQSVLGPPAAADAGPRRPVMATLRQALQGIQIVEEAAGNFQVPVDHRYDRLLPSEPDRRAGPSVGP